MKRSREHVGEMKTSVMGSYPQMVSDNEPNRGTCTFCVTYTDFVGLLECRSLYYTIVTLKVEQE
jgi:hypothetical protein